MSRGADHLWYDDLRKRSLRFRRMETIGRVSVDFFCSKALLAIDVLPDGSFDGAGLEEKRRYLRGFGIVLICYEEEQVLRRFEAVQDSVTEWLDKLLPTASPCPAPSSPPFSRG